MRYVSFSVAWLSIALAVSVSAVSCGRYHTEYSKMKHDEVMAMQAYCEKKNGNMVKSWGDYICETEEKK